MKKKYLKPVVEVYEMQLQGALLAASDPKELELPRMMNFMMVRLDKLMSGK